MKNKLAPAIAHYASTRFTATLWFLVASMMMATCFPNLSYAQPEDIIGLEEAAMRQAVAKVSDSIVKIVTIGGLERVGDVLIGTAPTTGLVVDAEGYIVSSVFNFIQQPTSILVTLPNGKKAPAKIVARDYSRKLVLLKVETEIDLIVPEAVPDDEIEVGQWALAVGRTFGTDFPNLSVGIVSATNRVWGRAIQTDSKVSPANYGGPLLDIRGRVFGVLTPMSPTSTADSAGTEWYDSGIGFAVKLQDVFGVLDKLKSGEDVHRGLLGIAMKGSNELSDPPIISSAPAGTPSAEAGIQKDDRIVSINGIEVQTQAQLKHVIGPLYAGDEIAIALLRGEEKIKTTAILTDKVEPYALPYLGVLPIRTSTDEDAGLKVRFVDPKGPATKAGIKAGDVLTHLGNTELLNRSDWAGEIASHAVGEEFEIRYQRDGKPRTANVKLAAQPETIPQDLPAASEPLEGDPAKSTTGLVTIKIPEEANECFAYVPETYDSRRPHSAMIWVTQPGEFDKEAFEERWKPYCEQHAMIVLAPQPKGESRWDPTEVAFIRKCLDDLMKNYEIDGNRVVTHGYKTGGTVAYYFGLKHRDVVRGIAAVSAGMPLRVEVAGNDPTERLSWYASWPKDSRLAKRIKRDVEQLRNIKFPVVTREQPVDAYLDEDQIDELCRWIDSLDRI